MGFAAVVTIALGAIAAAGLWLGFWPLAALALAFLIGGRREPATIAADAIAFAGLAGQADPLWVAILIVGAIVAREHDPYAILVVFLAAIAATFVYVDWTILTGLLAPIAMLRAALALGRALRPARRSET
jgi:hypothetical protein